MKQKMQYIQTLKQTLKLNLNTHKPQVSEN